MLPRKFTLLLLLATTLTLGRSWADVIHLKSGDKIEGKITAETATDMTVQVKVSAGITDEQTVKKADVTKVERESPDEAAYQNVKAIKVGADSLPAAQYDTLLNPLRGFFSQYSASSHAAEIKATADALEEEKKRVEAGEVKLSNKWLSKEEAQKERYQINGLIAFNFMRDQRVRGDFSGALTTFEQIEKNYPGSRTFPDAVELAQQTARELNAYVARRLPQVKAENQEVQKGIDQAAEPQRAELMAARQREQAQDDARIDAADKAGAWPPLIPRSEKSLAALANKVPQATSHLTEIPVAKIRQSFQASNRARSQLTAKDLAAAEASLSEAGSGWPANEIATRLQTELTALKATAAAAPPPEPEIATPPPAATPPPTVEPPTDETAYPQDEEKPSFFKTPLGIVTLLALVVLIVVGLIVYKKIKSRANETLE